MVTQAYTEYLRLLQERTVYLNHIYQLAASARSVVAENKMLRMRLEATKQSATLVRGLLCPSCQSSL